MKPLNLLDIAKVVKGTLTSYKCTQITGISTDSRTMRKGNLFFPLTGTNFDGHDFIAEAFKRGASASLCSKDKREKVINLVDNKNIIFVDDVLDALLALAEYYRSFFDIPFIAVTGSVGKTTTKDLIASVLGTRFNVLKTHGNYNNEIGLPLTLFKLEPKHEICVVEIGMSGFGEIRRLANIVKPCVSVITNIGIAHIEKLGSKENIAAAKMEILEPLKDGLAVLHADSPELWKMQGRLSFRVVYFGLKHGDLIAKNTELKDNMQIFETTGKYGNHTFQMQVPGAHNVSNALAAIIVGYEHGLSTEEISQGLLTFRQYKMRLEQKTARTGAIIIDDTYNASPDSMRVAIDMLFQKGINRKKAAILGDMLELGDYSEAAHFSIGNYVSDKTDLLVAVGKYSKYLAEGALKGRLKKQNIHVFNTPEEGLKHVGDLVKESDVILIKASRGLRLERFVQLLTGGS
ncbi:MAG: UDP-N-acetylmuramoyl-tripeptide--D-alanyl-D-alanine ligase [Tepidanaerobacteraceae bacterium]|jgi:UDP-N-acetylmuramoyl-tripeptide--D-alanyl-D-alanine ligase